MFDYYYVTDKIKIDAHTAYKELITNNSELQALLQQNIYP